MARFTLRPPPGPPERILGFGGAGTGKTAMFLSIARAIPDKKFIAIDTDLDSYERMLYTEYTDVMENGNVEVITVDDHNSSKKALEYARAETERDDWCSFDMTTATWEWVQDHYIAQIFDMETDEYFMQIRKMLREKGDKSKSLGALAGWLDWPAINKLYRPILNGLLNVGCNMVMMAEVASLGSDDDGELKNVYGSYGCKPKGQKRIPHIPHTSLLMKKNKKNQFTITTIKDRGRVEVEDQEIEDFAKDYLIGIAGWKKKLLRQV